MEETLKFSEEVIIEAYVDAARSFWGMYCVVVLQTSRESSHGVQGRFHGSSFHGSFRVNCGSFHESIRVVPWKLPLKLSALP